MGLPQIMTGERFSSKAARFVLPILVKCAKQHRTIEYGQLRQLMIKQMGKTVMAVAFRYPLGTIGDALAEVSSRMKGHVPPINALGVNKYSHAPGEGFGPFMKIWFPAEKSRYEDLSALKKRAVIEDVHKSIFEYRYWDDLLREFELEPFEGTLPGGETAPKKAPVLRAYAKQWSAEGESDLHEALKRYVCGHPELVGLPRQAKGKIEVALASGDQSLSHSPWKVDRRFG